MEIDIGAKIRNLEELKQIAEIADKIQKEYSCECTLHVTKPSVIKLGSINTI